MMPTWSARQRPESFSSESSHSADRVNPVFRRIKAARLLPHAGRSVLGVGSDLVDARRGYRARRERYARVFALLPQIDIVHHAPERFLEAS